MATIPEGVSGDWSVERFTVEKRDADLGRLRAAFSSSSRGRYVPEGTYTRLMRGETVVMSDTPDELHDLCELQHHARSGLVLVNGLGLGCAVQLVLARPEVDRVIVVEKSHDVIALVAPTLAAEYGPRLEIIEADAFAYQPPKGQRYHAVWHDIWDYICGDNLPEMTKLKRKYGRRTDWQGCWCEYQCRR